MKTIVAHAGFGFTDGQLHALHALARELSVELRQLPEDCREVSAVQDCEVMAGMFLPELLESNERLRWFHSSWAGVEKFVGLRPFRTGQAVLTNSAGAYNTMIAEHLMAGCLSLLHNYPAYYDAQRQHVWKSPIPAGSLFGKRVTVLGAGNTGGAFAKAASALGAGVTGFVSSLREKPAWMQALYSSFDALQDILPQTDILVLCLPNTARTRGLIGARELALLPPGALVLNSGRGQTLDLAALCDRLRAGQLAGAMLDVFPEEPLDEKSAVWDTPNLLITPHVAGFEGDELNRQRIFELFCENLRAWAEGKPLRNVIDPARGF